MSSEKTSYQELMSGRNLNSFLIFIDVGKIVDYNKSDATKRLIFWAKLLIKSDVNQQKYLFFNKILSKKKKIK